LSISAHELEEIARRAAWHVWNYQQNEDSAPMYMEAPMIMQHAETREFIRREIERVLEIMPTADNIAARIIGADEDLETIIEVLQNAFTSEQRAQIKAAL
jgi:hypothetical protein